MLLNICISLGEYWSKDVEVRCGKAIYEVTDIFKNLVRKILKHTCVMALRPCTLFSYSIERANKTFNVDHGHSQKFKLCKHLNCRVQYFLNIESILKMSTLILLQERTMLHRQISFPIKEMLNDNHAHPPNKYRLLYVLKTLLN